MKYKEVKFTPDPSLLRHPNIPKPLHGVNPRTIKGQEWWDIQRKLAYASTGFHCAACGVHAQYAEEKKHLEAHEIYDINYKTGVVVFQKIVPLCYYCHRFIHSGQTKALCNKGQITRKTLLAIFKHGKSVLDKAGLKMFVYPPSHVLWEDWVMYYEGKPYKSLFNSYAHWHEHFYGTLPRHTIFDEETFDDEFE